MAIQLYSTDSMVMHSTNSKSPLVRKLDSEWSLRKDDINGLLRQRFSPFDYHQLLYDHGEKV